MPKNYKKVQFRNNILRERKFLTPDIFPFLEEECVDGRNNNNNSFLPEWVWTFTLIYLKSSLSHEEETLSSPEEV